MFVFELLISSKNMPRTAEYWVLMGVIMSCHLLLNVIISIRINPLSLDMKMHILFTGLHTFLMELVGRICLNVMSRHLILADHFLFTCNSHHLIV